MNDAITSVYSVIAVWMPVTVVPTSLATVAIDTFMTELSRVIRNCPAASVARTSPVPFAAAVPADPAVVAEVSVPIFTHLPLAGHCTLHRPAATSSAEDEPSAPGPAGVRPGCNRGSVGAGWRWRPGDRRRAVRRGPPRTTPIRSGRSRACRG